MATKKDLLVLILDVGEHMQPYLPLLHRMVFGALNVKLLSKPNHEVAVVLYGTEGTRHKLYDPSDPASYHHVTVLRPLQNLGSYLELEPFAFATDPQQHGAALTAFAPIGMDPSALAEAEASLLGRVEAAGLGGRDAAAACGRAVRLFGAPGPKSDWADGLVVAMDVLASALGERFDTSKKEANKLGQLKIMLVSNLLGQSEPFEDDFRSALVDTCNSRGILFEVACLDHYVPLMSTSAAAAAAATEGADPLALLPAALAAVRRSNLEQLHLLKAELGPAPFRHLRQPAELLCLFRSKEVSYQASNAVFMLSPPPLEDQDATLLPPPLKINVKLYKKIRRTIVDEWRTYLDAKLDAAAAAGEGGGGGGGPGGGGIGGGGDDAGDGAGAAGSGGGGGGGIDRGFVRKVEYEDPTTGQKFSREDIIIKGFSYGKQVVPIPQYDEYGEEADEQMRKFKEKDFSLLGFVDAGSVPHHRLIDEPHVVLGDSAASAVAISSLALTLKEQNKAGLVRFIFRKQSPQLGLLTPHLSASPDLPHALLLSPLPFAEDIRTYTFSTFRNEQEARDLPIQLAEARGEVVPPSPQPLPPPRSAGDLPSQLSSLSALSLGNTAPEPGLRFERLQPDAEQQDVALTLVRALDLGPAPLPGGGARVGPGTTPKGEVHGEALAPEVVPNPVLQRAYALVTSRALDPLAQLPDPEDDPLVELVLQPHGRYWPAGAKEAIQRAEEKLQTGDRLEDSEPAVKRARREEGVDALLPAAAAAVAAGIGDRDHMSSAAAAAVLFDPTAAGGTAAARVRKVSELNAVEDFRTMLAQGCDSASEAVRQMQELVRELVSRSIGDQLYEKAVKCVQALQGGCASSGRPGAFNSFLRDLVTWCKSEDRAAFMSQLAARGVSLISAEDMERYKPPGVAGAAATTASGNGGGAGGGDAAVQFEDDGGAVTSSEARRFLDQMLVSEDVEVEATLPAVQQDQEFEDMD